MPKIAVGVNYFVELNAKTKMVLNILNYRAEATVQNPLICLLLHKIPQLIQHYRNIFFINTLI